MEDLYRRVSDRHTMGSVVGELKLTLSELERALDTFTRDSADKESLVSVPQQLAQMRGVLSVLGLDHASQAVDHMRGNVEDMLADEIDVVRAQEAGTFIHLANNLSALSFLIDMLNYQPVLARKLFVFDAALCELQPLMGRTLRASSAPATSPDPAGQLTQSVDDVMRDVLDDSPTAIDIPQLTQRLDHLANDAALADQPAVAAAARHAAAVVATEGVHAGAQALTDLVAAADPPPLEPPPAETGPAPAEDDLLDIFLEEACDVIQAGQAALTALAETPDSMPDMTTLRRTFHTLKGSSRMVGLSAFGEAAWALEQVMNAWLAESRPANVELCGACQQSLEKLNAWVDDIAAHTHGDWQAEPFARSAETLRLQGHWQSLDDFTDATVHTPFADTVPPGLEADDLTTERPAPVKEAVDLLEIVIGGVDAPVPLEVQSDAAVTDDTEPSAPEASLAPDNLIEWNLADGSDGSMVRAVPEPAQVPEVHGQEWSLDGDAGSGVTEAAPDPEPKTVPEPDGGLPVFELDFDVPRPASAPADVGAPAPELPVVSDEDVKVIGSLRLGVRLFNVFLNEADEWSRRLNHELSEWEMEHGQAVPDTSAVLAHSLAGASAAVGFTALADLARTLEHALDVSRNHAQAGLLATPQQAALFVDAAEDIRRLLHQFAAGFLKDPQPVLLEALNAFVHDTPPVPEPDAVPEPEVELAFPEAAEPEPEPDPVVFPMEAVASATPETSRIAYVDDDIDAVDTLDADLFQIFEEEAQDLLPHLGAALRQWVARPDNGSARVEVLRTLHTLKGSARLAGALRLGEMAHRMETQAERLGSDVADGRVIEPLLASYDDMVGRLDSLRLPTSTQVAHRITTLPEQAAVGVAAPVLGPPEAFATAASELSQTSLMPMDAALPIAALPPPVLRGAGGAAVRVRSDLLDRLVNQTGEVMIARSRMEVELGQLRGSLTELTGNLDRLRLQLRDIELQAESQMQSRMAHAKEANAAFDPLEFDRFTRVQELTRMMAESVNDVATVQRNLQRAVDATEDGLAAQARQTRELQRDLLRTRMVEFEGISDRLYRVVRQSAKETGKQVRLDIFGGSIEMDRGVLDRMTPAFEHLLRN
jgi:chemosensory pili system protein ChpA (sensor histidine kinase/response regulator)